MSRCAWLRPASAVLLAAALLAACAGSPQRGAVDSLPAPAGAAPVPDTVELPPPAPAASIPPERLQESLAGRRAALQDLLSAEAARGEIGMELRDGRLLLNWRASALFARGGAELRPEVLLSLSRVARWLRTDGAVVLQCIARGSDADADGLAERRAAALTAFLTAEGAPASLIRAQRVSLPQAPEVLARADLTLVVAPVVAGREAAVWTLPPLN